MNCYLCQKEMYHYRFFYNMCPLHPTDIHHSYNAAWELTLLTYQIIPNSPYQSHQYLLKDRLVIHKLGEVIYDGPIPNNYNYENALSFLDRLFNMKVFL